MENHLSEAGCATISLVEAFNLVTRPAMRDGVVEAVYMEPDIQAVLRATTARLAAGVCITLQ